MDISSIKQRFGIIGNSPLLDHALDIACQVAATDLSVLITGESGVGKETIPQVIHAYSPRKHGTYIAVNCGAIPEGTIDSELFGHEKGSFTGATEARKGYFEVADGGTLFLDEVAELPLNTQVRLLRVLETGEFLRVGSSQPQKTNVRVVAATNVNVSHAVQIGKFREDLFYRLNTVPIHIPALRERPEDTYLLFRKFAADFADRYHMPVVRLEPEARLLLEQYRWPGNIRQLKNVTEQISILEKERSISLAVLRQYLPVDNPMHLPVRYAGDGTGTADLSEKDILYKAIFQLRQEVGALQQELALLKTQNPTGIPMPQAVQVSPAVQVTKALSWHPEDVEEVIVPEEPAAPAEEETPSSSTIVSMEESMIKKALEKHHGHRRAAAQELGISERTLYRKIDLYKLNR